MLLSEPLSCGESCLPFHVGDGILVFVSNVRKLNHACEREEQVVLEVRHANSAHVKDVGKLRLHSFVVSLAVRVCVTQRVSLLQQYRNLR